MMRCSPFDFPGFYDSPGYREYGYYGYQPNYPRGYGIGHPLMETMPYLRREYGMPVEIPITHEGSCTCQASERKPSEAKKPRIPEDETADQETMSGKDIRAKKQPSPKPQQKKPSSMPYGMRQVPLNNVESSENMYDDEYPFLCPDASPETYEDRFPFGNGFPFHTSPRRSPFTNIPVSKTTSQKTPPKSAPKVVNKPAEKTTTKKTAATVTPQTAGEQQQQDEVRQVPIVMATAQDAQVPIFMATAQEAHAQQQPKLPAKTLLTAMEQLDNIQKEMEVIENRVENFSGEKKDKEYIILDETVTSLLLRLDMIESNGVEEIRNKRRQLVRHIQECVQKLEHKVGIVSAPEETTLDEAEVMEAGDVETESKEETDPEVTDDVMGSQDTAEQQTRVLDLNAERGLLTEGSSHHSNQSPRLEDQMQTQVDETVSPLQEMIVSQTKVNPEGQNRTFEQIYSCGW